MLTGRRRPVKKNAMDETTSLVPGLTALKPHDHVAVLVEPPVHAGLAVLINSLVRNGFAGTVWVGYRGARPPWAGAVAAKQSVAPDVFVAFVEMKTKRPLTYMKAAFMEELWAGHCPDAESIAYFDPDIAINRDWAFFKAWMKLGVAICEDAPHLYVYEDHPLRRVWCQRLAAMGLRSRRSVNRYYNAGFLGVHRTHRSFIVTLRIVSQQVEQAGHLVAGNDHCVTGVHERDDKAELSDDAIAVLRPYFADDQDALNMTVMATTEPLAPMGPDAMGFTPSWNFVMVHAVGRDKPWNTRFLRRALILGVSPTPVERTWWRYAGGPLAPMRSQDIRWRRAGLAAALAIARVRGR